MSISIEYSANWKDLGSALIYQSDDFQFNNSVIICEFENCLISKLSNVKLYHAIDPKGVTLYNEQFVKQIKEASKDVSIVILSNQISSNKLLQDTIKRKLEGFLSSQRFPVLAIFALKANRLSKPHTGMYTLLNAYYRSKVSSQIYKACVISDAGGRVIAKERKNGTSYTSCDRTDIDRAFAHNIGIPFYTIAEYLEPGKKEKYSWNNKCIPPEIRETYINKIEQYKNPNIFAHLFAKGKSDKYIIIIYGAPRSGQTTLALDLLNKWRTSEYGKTHAIKRFGRDKYSRQKRVNHAKKALENQISVIIDGECHTKKLREPFEELAIEHSTPTLYVEVDAGLGMSYLFNHVAVELSQDENVTLYDDKEYHIYKSQMVRPDDVIQYCPVIQPSKQLMLFRY